MTMDTLNLEIEILSETEAAAIWKRQSKRAANYAQYLTFIRARNVGDAFRVQVPKGGSEADNAKNAKEIRHNFTEAAKERTAFVVVDVPADVLAQHAAGEDFDYNGERVSIGADGKVRAERKAPVVLRWKVISHKEQREVTNDKGKKGVVEVTVIDALEGLIVASEAIQTRAKRTPREIVNVVTPPADAKTGTEIALSDGRKAKLGKDGKWRAPKLQAAPTPEATPNGANGTADVVRTDTPAATPSAV